MLVASVREGRDGRTGSRRWATATPTAIPTRSARPQTVVLADDLTREAIQEGIRAGRSYVAESKTVSLSFSASGSKGEHAGIGERLKVDRDDPGHRPPGGLRRARAARSASSRTRVCCSPVTVLPVSGVGHGGVAYDGVVRGVRTGRGAARGCGLGRCRGVGGVHQPDLPRALNLAEEGASPVIRRRPFLTAQLSVRTARQAVSRAARNAAWIERWNQLKTISCRCPPIFHFGGSAQ